MKIFTSLTLARALVILGFVVTLGSVLATIDHLGKDDYLFRGAEALGGGMHAWHHLFREAAHDVGAMVGILVLLFASPRYRNEWMWWGMLVAAVGLYVGYWLGIPFNPGYAAPRGAEPLHAAQAILALAGLLVAKRHFKSPAGA